MVTSMSDMTKYRGEFARALANHRYEVMDDGRVLIPSAGAAFGGVFSHRVDGGAWEIDGNIVVNEALNDVLSVYFASGAQRTAFYIAPFINNTTPVATLTGATFAATQGEFTNYTEATRQVWTPGAIAAQAVSNTAAAARFTIGTGGGTVRGAGLLTNSVKSATTGICVAAAMFDSASVLNAGSKLDIEYSITAQDV